MTESADIRTTERTASSVAKCDSLQRLVREFVDARLNDCMNVMAEYPDGHFDLAICDPPYGINVGFHDQRGKAANKPTLSKREANATPLAFAHYLLELAATCAKWPNHDSATNR